MAKPRLTGISQIEWELMDERMRRISSNFSAIVRWAADVERLWTLSTGAPTSRGLSGFGLPHIFGDGSDGDLTLTVNTSLSVAIKQYRNLTIPSSYTLTGSISFQSRLILFVQETLTVAGTIDQGAKGYEGGAASTVDGNGGKSHTHSMAVGGGGGGGGGTSTTSVGGEGGFNISGRGGLGGNPGSAGTAGAVVDTIDITRFRLKTSLKDYAIESMGGGGGSGGGDGTDGGAGGNGGGAILIFANEVLITSTGVITSFGANGDAAGAGNRGGGGGGAGGLIYIVTRNYTNLGSVVAAGGTGGSGSGTGAAGGAGSAGTIIVEEIPG